MYIEACCYNERKLSANANSHVLSSIDYLKHKTHVTLSSAANAQLEYVFGANMCIVVV